VVWCTRAKNYFRKNRVRFKEIDISKDRRAAKDCENHGCRGVPSGTCRGVDGFVGFEPRV